MNHNYHIRLYRASDFHEVQELWNQTGLGGSQRGDNHDVIERTIIAGGKFFILEKSETKEIIGTSWITNDGRRLYLHHFGIKPAFQGNGLSKLLLKETFDFTREQNLQIKLEVHNDNTIARQLYERSGFKYLGDYLVFIIRNVKDLKI